MANARDCFDVSLVAVIRNRAWQVGLSHPMVDSASNRTHALLDFVEEPGLFIH